jgi:hypothetical protein
LKKSRFHRRLFSFISFYIPVHHCSSPANLRWQYLEAGYWIVGHPEAAADDEFGEWILDDHDVLPRSYLSAHPKKVQPGMNSDERGVRQAKPGRGGWMT